MKVEDILLQLAGKVKLKLVKTNSMVEVYTGRREKLPEGQIIITPDAVYLTTNDARHIKPEVIKALKGELPGIMLVCKCCDRTEMDQRAFYPDLIDRPEVCEMHSMCPGCLSAGCAHDGTVDLCDRHGNFIQKAE